MSTNQNQGKSKNPNQGFDFTTFIAMLIFLFLPTFCVWIGLKLFDFDLGIREFFGIWWIIVSIRFVQAVNNARN